MVYIVHFVFAEKIVFVLPGGLPPRGASALPVRAPFLGSQVPIQLLTNPINLIHVIAVHPLFTIRRHLKINIHVIFEFVVVVYPHIVYPQLCYDLTLNQVGT